MPTDFWALCRHWTPSGFGGCVRRSCGGSLVVRVWTVPPVRRRGGAPPYKNT
jgi:hypothetical protein